ncbi:MAG: hypothetical protein ACXVCY_18110 [Pseudobdellovibrionaceae bacterium]
MKNRLLVFILGLIHYSFPSMAYQTFSCEGTPWKWNRTISKEEMYSVLTQTNRKKIISMAFYEMTHSSENPVVLPLTLYLANTEMSRPERGFWKTMAYISTQGKDPEKVYSTWPTERGVSVSPLSQTDICQYYNKVKK